MLGLRAGLLATVALAIVLALPNRATAAPAADFAPFTIEKTVWSATLTSFGPGTETFLIEYHDRTDWKVTQLSHSYTPGRAGTTWTFRNGSLVQYDALRNYTQTLQGPNILDNWIQPGLMAALAGSSRGQVDSGSAGATRITFLDNEGGHVHTTVILFSQQSQLPSSVEVRVDGSLRERFTYIRR